MELEMVLEKERGGTGRELMELKDPF